MEALLCKIAPDEMDKNHNILIIITINVKFKNIFSLQSEGCGFKLSCDLNRENTLEYEDEIFPHSRGSTNIWITSQVTFLELALSLV